MKSQLLANIRAEGIQTPTPMLPPDFTRKLTLYVDQGQLEIDNNWIENGIRPTAIGKKNWLFIGGEATGQRSAIIYTLIECARRNRRRDRSRWRHRSLFRVRGERR